MVTVAGESQTIANAFTALTNIVFEIVKASSDTQAAQCHSQ